MSRPAVPGGLFAHGAGALAALLAASLAVGCDEAAKVPALERDAEVDAQVVPGRPDFGDPPAPPPTDEMGALIDVFDGRVGFYARNLNTGDEMGRDGEIRFAAGGLSALVVAIAYAEALDDDRVAADDPVQIRPADLRGGGLSRADAGTVLSLDALMRRALDGDRTAEHLVTAFIGGPDAVNATLVGLDVPGIGRYFDPCERDRAWATGLDERFADVDCDDLGAWVHQGDASGIVPMPFATAPAFGEAEQAEAARNRLAAGAGTVTARGWARLLARLDAGELATPGRDARVRALLDAGRAAGGGDDGLPATIWSGSLEGRTEDGRHWAGRIRHEGDPLVLVVLTVGENRTIDPLVRSLGAGAWSALVDAIEWPPAAPVEPPTVEVRVLPAAAADACDAAGGFDDQIVCRTQASSEVYTVGDQVAVSVMVRGPSPREVGFIWSEPDYGRTRTQQRLGPSAWWVWSESRPAVAAGDWSVTVVVDGDVVDTLPFSVSDP